MGRHVLHYTYRILQTSLIVHCLPAWRTSRSSSTFSPARLGIVDLNVQTLSRSLVTYETWILFKGICSTHFIITKGFLKNFMGLRSWLLTVTTKLDNLLYSLVSAISLGYSGSRKHPRQTRLNVSSTKKQRSVKVTLNTLIHNKSTKRYLAARSCIISV
jgi:hypothetical protein